MLGAARLAALSNPATTPFSTLVQEYRAVIGSFPTPLARATATTHLQNLSASAEPILDGKTWPLWVTGDAV